MADENFYFSNGEILMKETFLIFSFWTKGHRTWRLVILGKKRGEKRNVKFRRSGILRQVDTY